MIGLGYASELSDKVLRDFELVVFAKSSDASRLSDSAGSEEIGVAITMRTKRHASALAAALTCRSHELGASLARIQATKPDYRCRMMLT